MIQPIPKYAVIVAGGSGVRMGSDKPKQFLSINGKSILWYTLSRFLNAFADLQVILVLPFDYVGEGKLLLENIDGGERIQIAIGGPTRFDSVKNGLQKIKVPGIVFVHDAVRCLVSIDLIHRCYEQALIKGSAIPAMAATDSIRIVEGKKHRVADRNRVLFIQTPQTFKTELLIPAFQIKYDPSFTDEATVLEAAGVAIFLIDGEYTNIKITRPIDLSIAEKILEDQR